jgi:hypothetical protein
VVKRIAVPNLSGMDLRSEFRSQEDAYDDDGFSFDEPRKSKKDVKQEKKLRQQNRVAKRIAAQPFVPPTPKRIEIGRRASK